MKYNIWKCKHCKETIKYKESASYLSLVEVPKNEFDSYIEHYESLEEHKCL